MLRGLGDDLDDNGHNDKGRFSGLIDFPVGQQEKPQELGLLIQ